MIELQLPTANEFEIGRAADQFAAAAGALVQQAQVVAELGANMANNGFWKGTAPTAFGWQARSVAADLARAAVVFHAVSGALIEVRDACRNVAFNRGRASMLAEQALTSFAANPFAPNPTLDEATRLVNGLKQGVDDATRKLTDVLLSALQLAPDFKAPKKATFFDTLLESTHLSLAAWGMVPGAGEFFDGADALLYLAQGKPLDAGLSASSMIPFEGWVQGGARIARTGDRVADAANAGRRLGALEDARKAAGAFQNVNRIPLPARGDMLPVLGKLPDGTVAHQAIQYGKVDELGRATGVSALLDPSYLRHGKGTTAAMRKNVPGITAADDAGHLLANVLGGGNRLDNYVPMLKEVNRGAMYHGFEKFAKEEAAKGNRVIYRVTPIYEGLSKTPKAVEIVIESSSGARRWASLRNVPKA